MAMNSEKCSTNLLCSTGSERADAILQGVIGIWESVFPGRVRGYYLFGSYADGTPQPASDLDLNILFKDGDRDDEIERAQRLCEYLEALRPAIFVDMGYLSEQRIQQDNHIALALRLKYSSRLIYGKDTRDLITAEPDARYVRNAMHIPYYGSKFGRPAVEVLSYPLDYPDSNSEFYGYDGWTLPAPNGEQPGTKMLVVIVGRIATALLAQRTGLYAGSKAESTALYREYVADEWTALVEQVYELCRNGWGYHIPDNPDERRQLRSLCQQALHFENYFFAVYRDFLLRELCEAGQADRLRALERLGQIIYPRRDVHDAVSRLLISGDGELSAAAAATLSKIDTAHTA